MTLVWNGDAIKAKMRAAAIVAIDQTLAECVAEAGDGHEEFPPASLPFTPWANRTHDMSDSVRIIDAARPVGLWLVSGTWGADVHYALFLEIGTSVAGATATERMLAADGNPNLIVPEIGPLMARRWALIPAWDRQTPLLAGRVRDAFNA